MYVLRYISTYVCIFIYTHICLHAYVRTYIHIEWCSHFIRHRSNTVTHTHVQIYVQIYIYLHTHHTHIHIEGCSHFMRHSSKEVRFGLIRSLHFHKQRLFLQQLSRVGKILHKIRDQEECIQLHTQRVIIRGELPYTAYVMGKRKSTRTYFSKNKIHNKNPSVSTSS